MTRRDIERQIQQAESVPTSSASRSSSPFSYTKEFHDLREYFEKAYKGERLDREAKDNYAKGWFYEHGQTNELFKAFMQGYQLGKMNQ